MVAELDDSTLLRRYARERDEAAFAELVRRYLGVVYHSAVRQAGGRTDVAGDVAQRTFVLLARKAGALSRHTAIAGWLHTTARHVTEEAMRSERRRRLREQEAHAMQELTRDEDNVNWEQLRPVLDASIGQLNDHDREAVVLRYFAALPLAEVGRRLGVNENTARMRIDRALEKLDRQLRRRGVTSTASALSVALAHTAAAAPAVPAGLAASVTSAAVAATSTPLLVGGALIGFMASTKWVASGAAALVLLAVTGGVVHQRQRLAAMELEALRSEHARSTAALENARRLSDEAEQGAAALKTAAAQTAAPPRTVADVAPPPQDRNAQLRAEGAAFMARHEAVRSALAEYMHASVRFQFAPLYRKLGLTPEQIREFEYARGARAGMGASTAEDRSMTLSLWDGKAPVGHDRIREILGEEGFREFRAYETSVTPRTIAAEVASALYFTDTPLTPVQAGQLAELLQRNRRPREQRAEGEFDWTAIIEQARGVLAAPQIEVLAGRRAKDQFNAILNRPRPDGSK